MWHIFFTISNCSRTFFSNFCHLPWVFSCHPVRAIAVSLLWGSVSQELDWLSLGWWSCLDDGKERPSCVGLLLCFFLLLPAMSWFPAFLYPSFHFWLLFAFPLHSLLFVLFCTCLPCRKTFGEWGGEEACYQSKYLVFFHSFPSFTLPALLLTAMKLPSVKASPPCSHSGDCTRAVIFPSLMGICIRQSFFILCCILTSETKVDFFFKFQTRQTLFEKN